MEGIALDLRARHRRVQKSEIERGIVADQDRALAAVAAHGFAHFLEDPRQRVFFIDGRS